MKILILGAGMYVTGRGRQGNGVVLSALAEFSRQQPIEAVVVARQPENARVLEEALTRINGILSTDLRARYVTLDGHDLAAETTALCQSEKFDCAIIVTPDHLHFAPLSALLALRVPPLVVKPLVPTMAEARQLLALQQQYDVYGAVEFHKRFDESNLYARHQISSGALGQLLYATVDYSQRIIIPTEIFRGWASQSNIFQYLGVHYVDMMYFLTGYHPLRLTAFGTKGVLQAQGLDNFDSIHVSIEWANPQQPDKRFLTQFNTNWIDPNCTSAMSDQQFKLVGTRGRLHCDQKHRGLELVQENQGIVHPNPYFADYLPSADGKMHFQGYGYRSISQFMTDVLALQQGTISRVELERCRPSFQDSLISVAIIESVNLALQTPAEWREIDALSG